MKNLVIISALLLGSFSIYAQKDLKKEFNQKKGVAIEGYDPVSYFNNNPTSGTEEYSFSYQGVTYYFNNEENLKKFESAPEKYEPQYGGWCAYAMGQSGDKVKINPETYKIKDGRLYLFYNFKGQNTLDHWNKDEVELKEKADKFWKELVD